MSLALEVHPHLLRAVEASGVREFHLAPVVGALARARQIKEAVEMVAKMEGDGMTVSPSTVGPLIEAFNTPPAPEAAAGEEEDARGEKERVRGWNPSVEARTRAVDESYELLLGLVSQGQKVPRVVLNGLVLACVRVPDLVRALETYREFGPGFDVEPDAWTFESLLEGCVKEQNSRLADGLLDEMKAQVGAVAASDRSRRDV